MLDLTQTYEVVIFSIGDTKAGTKMGKLQLKNLADDSVLNCILWEEALNRIDGKVFRTGNHVKILGGSYNEKYNNCLVTSVELVKEAKLGLDKDERDKLFNGIVEYANEIEDEELKKYVTELLFEHEEQFKIAPAARLMHHNYLGGLVEHTFECLEIAKCLINNLYKKVDKSSVYAACILHDFGKIFEYKIDTESGLIEYDEKFPKEWLTHSQWGFSNCMAHGFKTVAKMIAAHHGRAEWGAIVDLNEKDLDPLMYLVHHIDDLSAKFGRTAISDLG
ncbi:MAG TPA: HD domain-containing protein [Candidatus Limenecus avicola]|jgi:3'-5' exoribonuclease yhaM|uniref:HD domain-containing protein n=1 Tax=Candidatus Limenecus avicola TaxID=2840847 RepID=A0A9D1SR72_9CLOT|nr:HD domain-containing protein [Clostridium sp.]HIU91722.1 HD domain-containing protein [Candidatus Limenecus avicola]